MNLRPLPAVSTLVDLLRARAAADPGLRGFTFLLDGERDEASLAYGELDRRARAIAVELRRHAAPGDRAVLLFAPGLDYIAAFFGCLYAGVIAVPVYPPDPARLALTLPRLAAIFADAGVAAVLTDRGIAALAEPLFAGVAALEGKRWVATDALEPGLEAQWRPPAVGGDDVAFLQYTSGSTGTPKGVRVSHANLLDNLALIGDAFGLGARSAGVIWLPPYHDMGLIGGILEPLYRGFPVVLMSPIAFLQRPARWVEAVSRYRATCSGGPNFAFDLVVRKTTEEQRAALDLSAWDLAFCGAEPVRSGTFERFAAAFAPAGFRREAFYTCYGLAEGTLIVTGASKGAPPRFEAFDADALRAGAAEPTRDDAAAAVLADCGAPLGDWRLAVVDPATGEPRGPRRVGEIWIAGPSAARGYWGDGAASARAFGATLPGDPSRPFLRTGDLGFVEGGRLFVTGRLKDLLIVRGRNHYPHDVEASVERAHPLFRAGCGAAFTVDGGDDGERLVVVQEVERGYRPGGDPAHPDPHALATLARRAIAEGHGLHAYDVLLLPPNTVPKTSSGKVQRHACKLAYLEGALEPLGSARVAPAGGAGPERPAPRGPEAWLADALAALVGVEPARVDPDAPLTSYGLDSMQAVHLQAEIEGRAGRSVPLATLLGGASLREVAGGLPAPALPAPAPAAAVPPAPAAALGTHSEHAPSDGQRALWFLHRLAPESA
ncbi:MAG TPA: AMP-binding protein, partial [Polyangiaceae bacterium]|nr:AMP-binding protein [Polyangiaceae bacterium]